MKSAKKIMSVISRSIFAAFWFFVIAGLHLPVVAEDGVTADKIVLGQVCALQGHASSLGIGMNCGLQAYFNKLNAAGGVHGRTIELKVLDDGYEPDQCVAATKKMIEEEKVFMLVGGVGTPTSKVAAPVAEASGVPFVAPFTGAELLRNPYRKYVINVRASYYEEMETLAEYLVDNKGLKRIACFYQDDVYGLSGLDGIKIALKRRNMELVAVGTYARNTVEVGEGLTHVADGKPEAVVMVGAYEPCAAFIRQARENQALKDAVLCNISFVGTRALLDHLGAEGDGCIVTQVVPLPWDTTIPLVAEFQESMKAAGFEDHIGFVSLEGYLAGKFVHSILEQIEGEPTREGFMATVQESGALDLGGVTVTFGPEDHQGMDDVFLTVLKNGKVELLK